MLRTDLHVRSGPAAGAWVRPVDRSAPGTVHTGAGGSVAARNVDHEAIRVVSQPGLIARIIVAKLPCAHPQTFIVPCGSAPRAITRCIIPTAAVLQRVS